MITLEELNDYDFFTGVPDSLMKPFIEEVINSDKEHHRKLIESPDLFSLSEVRDLLFHVQEHTFTIPIIKEVLSKNGLVFCGFESPKIKKLFKVAFT